ncbi:MAG: hypothetical protein MZU95_10975 [Desulfomicrobium escambiense]|nr:hypothetical protein [Desulfomicrobium escambiense]
MATLAADRYGEVQGVYTFGSPRVGNSRFERPLRDPDLPLRQRQRHGGAVLPPPGLLCARGRAEIHRPRGAHPGPVGCNGPVMAASQGEGGEKAAVENGPPKTPVFMPDAVIDHVPVLYAVMIWNRLADDRADVE